MSGPDGPVVLGAGLAGLSAALALAPLPVTLISPCPLGQGCSSDWAQGGIAAAVGEDDSALLHSRDTMAAGAGLNDAAIVDQVTQDGFTVITMLTNYGAPFDRDSLGKLRLGLEAAHNRRRIVHAKDATGHAVTCALINAVRAAPHITIIENAQAVDLVSDDRGVCAVVLRKEGVDTILVSDRIILATGGAGALWRDTTNPHTNWGSGMVLAARAGAALGELEFAQFHPTAIDCGRDPMPLASEALRGEGVKLIDEKGERFTDELQPRDIVARAIWKHISDGHKVFLDTPKLSDFAARFPNIFGLCQKSGIDPVNAPIPVRPAMHYHMGGVITDAHGRTGINGLWACGEVACTGLHGANRLASNSLLEAASFGPRVAQDVKGVPSRVVSAKGAKTREMPSSSIAPATIRGLMSDYAGVIRDRRGLQHIIDTVSLHARKNDMALIALMIATAALRRQESRGAHFRRDFPRTDAYAHRTTMTLDDLELPL